MPPIHGSRKDGNHPVARPLQRGHAQNLSMSRLQTSAPAKVNLTLRVLSRRPDGYHELASLVAFATVGDDLLLEPAATIELEVVGPMGPAAGIKSDNLVLKAARAFAGSRTRAASGSLCADEEFAERCRTWRRLERRCGRSASARSIEWARDRRFARCRRGSDGWRRRSGMHGASCPIDSRDRRRTFVTGRSPGTRCGHRFSGNGCGNERRLSRTYVDQCRTWTLSAGTDTHSPRCPA